MREMLKKADRIIGLIEKQLLNILFLAMAIIVILQVFNRALLNFQMAWADEAARYLFVWLIFVASAYAIKEKAHIGVTAVVGLLPDRVQKALGLFSYVVCMLFCIAFVYFTAKIISVQILYGQISPSLRIPMPIAYGGMVVGGVLMVANYVLLICSEVSGQMTSD